MRSLCQTDLLYLHLLLFLLLITLGTSNESIVIKEIYRYVSRTVSTTNEGRDFIETIVGELVNKKKKKYLTNQQYKA